LPGPADLGGCPDTDADGVIDPEDRCPNTPGLSEREGCPEIEEEDKAVLKLAMETVRFETASARLKPASLAILDQVADVLAKYPDYGLRISGHTDNQGKDESNQDLSERRAQSCLQHLAGAGIDDERMLHEGFGETRPIGDNATAEGRRLNRRVEFELFVQEKQVEQVEQIARTEKKTDTVTGAQTESASPPPPAMADSLLTVAPDLLPQSAETIAQGQVGLATQPSTIPSRPDSLQTIAQTTAETNKSKPETDRPGSEELPDIEPGETPAADSLQTTAAETIAQTTAETNKSKPETDRPGSEELPDIETGEIPVADSLQTTAAETIVQMTAETNKSKPETDRPGSEELPNIETGEIPVADSLQTTAAETIAQTTAETKKSKPETDRPGSEELPAVPPGESTTADSLSRAKAGMIAQTPPAVDTSITASPNNTDTVVAQPITPPARPETISAAEPAAASPAPTVRPLQPRIFETPDTIYWFEPDENLLSSRPTMVDIELPETYLQPEPSADTARQAPPALPPSADVLTPKEPLSPIEKKAGELVPKSTMEQKIEALERRIEALEEQIRRLEKLLINQSSVPQDSSQTNPPPVKKLKEGNG
jgi:outer membrane protein OmpA-like peptidoglycan-associated protein